MSGYDIILAMGGIDDDLILDAKRHKRAIPVWLRWGALTACLCCAVLAAGVLSLRLFGGESTPGPEMLASGVEVSAAPEPEQQSSGREENNILAERNGYVILEDTEYGLKLEVPEDMAEDVVCNKTSGTPFRLHEPTSYEALYIEELGTGGGFVWEILVETYDEFTSLYSLDPTQWTTTLPGVEMEMIGRTEECVYTVRRPSDVQFTIETESAYEAYKKTGDSILKRFLEINGIEANPEWVEAHSGEQEQNMVTDGQQEEPMAKPSEAPDEPTGDATADVPTDAEAAMDTGVYARDKAYSSKAEGVPAEALEEFTVWFESPATDGREKFCTDPWSWTFSVTEGTDMAQWGDVMLECRHENGIDSQVFYWVWGGTITWGPTASPGDA